MAYLITKVNYGREERVLDLPHFTADLCKAMGGKPIARDNTNDLDRLDPRFTSFEFDGVEIGLTKSWRNGDVEKVTVRAAPLDVKLGYNDVPSSAEYKLPEAGISTARSMKAIIADVKRRVVEPAKAPIAARHRLAGELAKRKFALGSRAAELRKLGLDVRLAHDATYSGTFYKSDPHISGQFYGDGTVSIERIGSISADTFERVLAALGKRAAR